MSAAITASAVRLLAVLLFLASVDVLWAADLPVSIVRVSSPAAPFSDATLEAQTTPGADCRITVFYKSGPSTARGLVPRQADRRGRVVWIWRVGSNTTPGRWPIEVVCQTNDGRGEARTTFEVR